MTSDRKEASAARELAILERAGNFVVRDADGKPTGLTASGLALVEKLATRAGTQNFIASKLGLTSAAFKKILGKIDDDSAPRLAWERGRAQHEQNIIQKLMMHGEKNVVALIFYSKAKLGWREVEPPAAFESNIKIVLPGALSQEQYFASLGIDAPVLANNLKTISPTRKAALPAPNETSKPPLNWETLQSTDESSSTKKE